MDAEATPVALAGRRLGAIQVGPDRDRHGPVVRFPDGGVVEVPADV